VSAALSFVRSSLTLSFTICGGKNSVPQSPPREKKMHKKKKKKKISKSPKAKANEREFDKNIFENKFTKIIMIEINLFSKQLILRDAEVLRKSTKRKKASDDKR
jgi:hypothetical protein